MMDLLIRYGFQALGAVLVLVAGVLVSRWVALDQLGFQIAPLIAGIGVAGVGVGFALQGVLSNLMAGLTIIFTKPFRVGEYEPWVAVADEGAVESDLYRAIVEDFRVRRLPLGPPTREVRVLNGVAGAGAAAVR